ncbi:DUF2125 domain-containing protein [Rhodosalinus halophilus]|uniref:DUF2125 domain-containing protein n=2 Tax=Rhodosalinus halophilus TaxID=2259333 RepID=A0A365U804_9RHOB|nr:DUF2125 domain-containing protein [Rhodosalinus halophilus]
MAEHSMPKGFIMRFHTSTAVLALVAGTLAGQTAADVTARQVWDDMRGYLGSFGYEITATDSMSGDTLTARDVTMSMALPEDGGSVALEIPALTFTENGDGTVTVTYPEITEIRIEARPPDAEAVDMTLDLTQSGLEVLVSGDDTRMVYDYVAERLGVTLAELVVEGDPVPRENVDVSVSARDMSGESVVVPGDIRALDQTLTVAEVTYDVTVIPPEDGAGRADFNGSMQALSFEGMGRIPEDMDMENLSAAFAAGYAFDGRFGYSDGRSEFLFEEEGQTVQGTTRSDRTEFRAAMNAERLSYGASGAGTEVRMETPDLPFPVEAAIGETGFEISAPVGSTDEPQPFGLSLAMRDFTMGEPLWAMFDPGQMLPREPATVVLDLSGMARTMGDIFDPQAMQSMAMNEEVPAELHALDLSRLLVSALGAGLTGEGAFTFDNQDLETFDGMPRPEGTLSLRLEGANALLDTLMQMGLLPEEQAMGARMMMGMFAVPAGEDVLESTIEINEQGQVLANGQRIQ